MKEIKRRAYAVVSPMGTIEVNHIRWKKSDATLSYVRDVNLQGGFALGNLTWKDLTKMGWKCLPINLTV